MLLLAPKHPHRPGFIPNDRTQQATCGNLKNKKREKKKSKPKGKLPPDASRSLFLCWKIFTGTQ